VLHLSGHPALQMGTAFSALPLDLQTRLESVSHKPPTVFCRQKSKLPLPQEAEQPLNSRIKSLLFLRAYLQQGTLLPPPLQDPSSSPVAARHSLVFLSQMGQPPTLASKQSASVLHPVGDWDGDSLGAADGVRLGTSDGDTLGALLGEADGVRLGTSDGDSLGALLGVEDGSRLGTSDGDTLGALLGVEDGLALGTSVGASLGALLGAEDGLALGLALGTSVGASLGALLGAEDGLALGSRLGTSDGDSLGALLGAPEGLALGLADGAAVVGLGPVHVHVSQPSSSTLIGIPSS
jgi:hypothetical protein